MGFIRLGIGLFFAAEIILLTGVFFSLATIQAGIYALRDDKTMPSESNAESPKPKVHLRQVDKKTEERFCV